VASLCGDDLRQGGQVVLSVAGSVSPLSQRRGCQIVCVSDPEGRVST
jgi:hypothetical protein